MTDFLTNFYPWIKSLHIIAVISWMAGLLYLPRLFIYHKETLQKTGERAERFERMEHKLLRIIMNPAMLAVWLLGLCLMGTPGIVDWSSGWPWVKLVGVLGLTAFHMWCAAERKRLKRGTSQISERGLKLVNEVPTVLMILVVIMVVVKPF